MQRFVLAALFTFNAGCGFISVQGPTDPSGDKEPAPDSASEAKSSPDAVKPGAGAAAAQEPEVKELSADADAQRNLLAWHSPAEELERLRMLPVTFATEGISAADFSARIQRFYKEGESPSPKTIASRDELADRFAKALASAAAKGEAPKRGTSDAKAEKSIREHFERGHKGATIKAVYLTDSAWKQNYTDALKTQVRNRYKEGVVIIAIKDRTACVAVPASVAQASTGNGGFAPEYKHDSFRAGRVVPCP